MKQKNFLYFFRKNLFLKFQIKQKNIFHTLFYVFILRKFYLRFIFTSHIMFCFGRYAMWAFVVGVAILIWLALIFVAWQKIRSPMKKPYENIVVNNYGQKQRKRTFSVFLVLLAIFPIFSDTFLILSAPTIPPPLPTATPSLLKLGVDQSSSISIGGDCERFHSFF